MKDDALYLEADEDITSAIDKLHKSNATTVQIVVPKRSTMLQSIINLKLLKKAAESDNKKLVLVTGDHIATDLAGRVGLAVAPSLGAKAVITEAQMPEDLKTADEVIEETDPEPPHPETPTPVPPTKGAGRPPMLKRRPLSEDSPPPPPPPDGPDQTPSPPVVKPPKVPNFGLLKKRLIWVGLLVVIIVGLVLANFVFATAKVVLFVQATRTDVSTTFSVNPTLSQSNLNSGTLAGQTVTVTHTLNGTFTPTGTQNIGTKATGTMTVYNAYDESSHPLVAGTRFAAPDGNVFLLTANITVPPATTTLSGGHVSVTPGSVQAAVQADQNGDTYNEAPATYTIPGLPSSEQSTSSGIYGKGSQMTGGTTKTVKVVAQADITNEQAALLAKDQGAAAKDLASHVPAGYTAMTSSLANTVSSASPSPAVGAQATSGSLQLSVAYTELAVKSSDYKSFVDQAERQQVGSANQIYDDGLSAAQITLGGKGSSGSQTFSFTTEAFSGAKLNTSTIATQLKGHRYGDAANIATALPGVTQATINIWPSWDGSLPSSAGKIKVTISVAKQ